MTTTPATILKTQLTQTDHLSISDDGDLMIEGCVARDMVERFGSPLFVFSEATLRDNIRRVREAFQAVWPASVNVMYAIKANSNFALRAIAHQEGAGGDCFGLGELEATFAGSADPTLIALNGSNKETNLLRRAVELGVTINLDDEDEIGLLENVVSELDSHVRVNIRLKVVPDSFKDLESDAYPYPGDFRERIRRSKWGVTVETAERMIHRLKEHERIDLAGYHTHWGRMSRDLDRWADYFREYANIIVKLKMDTGFTPRIIDLGGGWPRERDPESRCKDLNSYSIEEFAKAVSEALRKEFDKLGMPVPALWVEPGRYIAGNAGVLLTTVGTIKRDAEMTWINVDASGNLLTLVDKFGSVNHVTVVSGMNRPLTQKADVVGPICVPSDLASDCALPDIERGEVLVVLDAGTYAESESSQRNSMPRPATVLVHDGEIELIKRREVLEDLFATQIFPERLRKSGKGDSIGWPLKG